jgi:asparagine synthase (glutamine-hydrolysing)
MSVQFGRWNFEGQPLAPDDIEKVSVALAPYGADSNESYSKCGVRILYRAFHTTKESREETQPHVCQSGAVLTWDGRLDNRAELLVELRRSLAVDSSDVAIVAAAYNKWEIQCFAKLVGDWALSIWNPNNRSLILAKDPLGVRHIYYSIYRDHVTWSTILDPLVLFANKKFQICEEYIAGWFSYFPAAHLTPYVGIHAVPPSSFVALSPGKRAVSKYWDFDPAKRIRYRTDAEYEEHFRAAFAKAVHRRLRADQPILAELSGGLDSSSIVCMADNLIARGEADTPRLDTISWYDDSYDHVEPDTNELHWITKVEEKRGRAGHHINVRELKVQGIVSRTSFIPEFDSDRFAATPSPNKELPEHFKQYAAHMLLNKHRVTLSGIGGDEVTGGDAPTPTLELRDLLARARFLALARQLKTWATKMRTPPLPLLWKAVRGFLILSVTGIPIDIRPASWLHPGFAHRNYTALCGYPSRVKLSGLLPSFQENLATLNVLRRHLADWLLHVKVLREVRFPYLDRDFLEFMYAIPREQIVGVGKRRFLMKRALVGLVPEELLSRRRKAFVRQQTKTLSEEWAGLIEPNAVALSSSINIIDRGWFLGTLQELQHNDDVAMLGVMRTLTLERWLSHLTTRELLMNPITRGKQDFEQTELRSSISTEGFS